MQLVSWLVGWLVGWLVRWGMNASVSEEGPVAGSCEHGNELSGSLKGGEFLD
jgi:hypothetical protein